MKTLYLAGPMLDCSQVQATSWRDEVKRELEGIYEILDPMEFEVKVFAGKELEGATAIVETDLFHISKSDYVLAHCWKPSPGTAMELVYAKIMKKEIVVVNVIKSPWIKYHSSLCLSTLTEAIQALKMIASELKNLEN